MKITFLDAATLGDDMLPQITRLFGGFGEVVMRNATTEDEVGAAIKDSDVLVVNKVRLNRGNLGAAKSLKLICEAATGYD
ncbi:MAG: hydroxyacid dehydrogenase, partial [Monoglobaceae bacterium]